MKELSIEEEAKAYREAIERAKKWYNAPNIDKMPTYGNRIIEEIFPELIKYNNEKVRGAIIHFISHTPTVPKGTINKKTMLTWLEKQGQTFTKEDTDNANKVEPKFKAGNWYQCTKDFFGKGVTFDKNTAYYCAQEGCLQNEYGCHIAIVKDLYDNFKLWTIQDAKDGDVLIDKSGSREGLFIFKETKPSDIKTDVLNNPLTVLGYCGIGGAGFTKGSGWGDTANCTYYPATKKQRDTLFKAMANAGYTFNFEKKKLNKIEQKYTPKHKVGDTIYYNSFGKGKSMIVANVVTDSTDNPMYEDKEGNAVFEKDLIEKPTAWSEEDEYIIERLSYLLDNEQENYPQLSCDFQEIQEFKDWLKSLKQRIKL